VRARFDVERENRVMRSAWGDAGHG
jgi:hypothetical protein